LQAVLELSDLPALQANKFEFVINSQTAPLPGIEVPSSIPSLADEVIEQPLPSRDAYSSASW
jgi:hypothetical protein